MKPKSPTSGWGGARPNSGRKSDWNDGETKVVRVAVSVADILLRIGKKIAGKQFSIDKCLLVDLSNLKTYKLRGEDVVKVSDLVKENILKDD